MLVVLKGLMTKNFMCSLPCCIRSLGNYCNGDNHRGLNLDELFFLFSLSLGMPYDPFAVKLPTVVIDGPDSICKVRFGNEFEPNCNLSLLHVTSLRNYIKAIAVKKRQISDEYKSSKNSVRSYWENKLTAH